MKSDNNLADSYIRNDIGDNKIHLSRAELQDDEGRTHVLCKETEGDTDEQESSTMIFKITSESLAHRAIE